MLSGPLPVGEEHTVEGVQLVRSFRLLLLGRLRSLFHVLDERAVEHGKIAVVISPLPSQVVGKGLLLVKSQILL